VLSALAQLSKAGSEFKETILPTITKLFDENCFKPLRDKDLIEIVLQGIRRIIGSVKDDPESMKFAAAHFMSNISSYMIAHSLSITSATDGLTPYDFIPLLSEVFQLITRNLSES